MEFQSHLTWNMIAEKFFRYAYAKIEGEGIHSFWLLQFSDGLTFFGVIEQ